MKMLCKIVAKFCALAQLYMVTTRPMLCLEWFLRDQLKRMSLTKSKSLHRPELASVYMSPWEIVGWYSRRGCPAYCALFYAISKGSAYRCAIMFALWVNKICTTHAQRRRRVASLDWFSYRKLYGCLLFDYTQITDGSCLGNNFAKYFRTWRRESKVCVIIYVAYYG